MQRVAEAIEAALVDSQEEVVALAAAEEEADLVALEVEVLEVVEPADRGRSSLVGSS